MTLIQSQEKEEEEDDGNSSDSSSSSESTAAGADESDQEEDDGVVLDTEEEETPLKSMLTQDASNAPMLNEDSSSESDGSSDLENAYPRLPSAPVDALIALRRQAAREDLQMSSELKDEEVARARQRQQERHELAQRAKRRKKTTQTSKRRHSKQGGDAVANGSGKTARSGRRHSNGTNGHADVTLAPPLGAVQQQQMMTEDEWMVDCSCGRREKNFDDGSSMIQCDSCSHWVHAKCADKLPEAVAQENFLCFRCGWMFDCVCDVRRRPNHDDGQRMVECEGCKTWQHTACVGVPMTEEPPDSYLCPRCVKKASRRKAAAKPSAGHLRQRKRDHLEPPRRDRKSRDASPVPVVDMRASAPSGDSTTAVGSTATNKKKSDEAKPEKKEPLISLPPPPLAPAPTPTPAASPPSTPPPPPSTPPPPSVAPPHALPGFAKHEQLKRKKERVEKHLPSSKSSSNRKRGRPHGSSSSSSKKKHPQLETPDVTRLAPPPATVTPSPTGKGAMIRGFSASTPSLGVPTSLSVIVRPPLPLTPPSGGASSGHSHSSHGHGGRKRKGGSARDRLAKKLKIKKSSRR
ncbi:hypothetical protein BBJ28_00015806 [Nothophytophthora sp. Chile5]|nr:hypothetical protein BBJ28_00015806 [Nothophytophthora sp. Chile5]